MATTVEIPRGPMGEAMMVADGLCPRCGGRLERTHIGDRPDRLIEVGECFPCIGFYRVTTERPFGDVILETYDPLTGRALIPVSRRVGGQGGHIWYRDRADG